MHDLVKRVRIFICLLINSASLECVECLDRCYLLQVCPVALPGYFVCYLRRYDERSNNDECCCCYWFFVMMKIFCYY